MAKALNLSKYKKRRVIWILVPSLVATGLVAINPAAREKVYLGKATEVVAENRQSEPEQGQSDTAPLAREVLEKVEVKNRAPKTGYSRKEFYDTWPNKDGCNLRQRILKRDFGETAVLGKDNCTVVSGKFYEPYTGTEMEFKEKSEISKGIQIDHIVALSDAWQKGAQYKPKEVRFQIATDPVNLIAAEAAANQQKSDGDAATWLPKNKSFRCQYVARQIAVKFKYALFITPAEKEAMKTVLSHCPEEKAMGVSL